MAVTVEEILKERKYPFILAFFLLLVFVTLLLISYSQSPISISAEYIRTEPVAIVQNNPPPPPEKTDDLSVNSSTNDKAEKTDDLSGNISSNDKAEKSDDLSVNSSTNATDVNVIVNENVNVDNGVVDEEEDDRVVGIEWGLCKGPLAVDYIPCLDNMKAIQRLPTRRHMEHRERHCPERSWRCLVPLPKGYKTPVPWPKSRDMIWYNNVPHPKLVEYKKDQRWVVKSDDYFIFPGGGTQFKDGVDHYIDLISKTLPVIEWGTKTRVILDVGCGVASFGGSLLDRNVITLSFAPKDEHEAQIQFALERGIPATLSVIGTQKLPFPDNSFDLIHCARCRVHWDADGGKPLMELNRIVRPGGYFLWSATPVYRKEGKEQRVWRSMVALTEKICWKVVAKTYFNSSQIGIVIYQKPISSSCYENRIPKDPPMCDQGSRTNSSWYTRLDSCLVPLPSQSDKWTSNWPERLSDVPLSLSTDSNSAESFKSDTTHWSALVSEVYLDGLAINWSSVRNVMDMNAGYGGFATAIINQPLWVMNVIPIHEPDTLPVIFDRGLIGLYHDWCESFNTYPRTYDLLHASFLFGNLTKRCDIIDIAAEMDRILRPGGYLLVQDSIDTLNNLTPILKSLHWSVKLHQDQFLVGKKGFWRPGTRSRV